MAMEPAAISAQPGGDDDAGRRARAGNARRQRKRDGQAIGHADDDVAHGVGSGEMMFDVRGEGHDFLLNNPD